MKARLARWNENGTYFEDLPTHICTAKELGLVKDKSASRFYPVFTGHKKSLRSYTKYLHCFNGDFDLYGDYNSEEASVFSIYFEKCNGSNCKNETEITNWIRRKFILTLEN